MMRNLLRVGALLATLRLAGGCTSEKQVCHEKYEPMACSFLYSALSADSQALRNDGMTSVLLICAAQLQYQSRCNKESAYPTVLNP